MTRIPFPLLAGLAACAPSPQEAVMHNPGPAATPMPPPAETTTAAKGDAAADLPPAALGRRILSTAFVMVGPDRHLTVEQHGGRVVVLRDVTMGPKDYCGTRVADGVPGGRYCGDYAEVAAARPGGAPIPAGPPDASAADPGRAPPGRG